MAYEGGRPLILSAIADGMPTLSAAEAVAYAPTAGVEQARTAWKDAMARKNPTIDPANISLPAVVPGLTAGISYVADLFLDEGTPILVSDPSWDNYGLIFTDRRGASITEVPFFGAGPGLDMAAIASAVRKAAKTGAVRIILNFPQNPTGYSIVRRKPKSSSPSSAKPRRPPTCWSSATTPTSGWPTRATYTRNPYSAGCRSSTSGCWR
jgi:aspartate/methionine/tyrosine aminotransferase